VRGRRVFRVASVVLGALLLVVALALCLLPGPLAACGSLLAPMFPVRIAVRCPASQNTYFLGAVVAGIAGLAVLTAGMVLGPSHRSRSRQTGRHG